MKQIFVIVSFIIVTFSCKKTDNIDSQSLNGKFKTGNILTVNSPVMYVQNFQITDTGIINSYLRAHNFINNFIYTSTQLISDTLLVIEFGTNDSANYKPRGSSVFFKAKKISYPNNQLLIKRYDSSMLLINPYPLVPVPVRCDSLSSMAQYIFPLTYYIVTPVLNSAIQVRFGGFPLIFQNGQLSLNLFTYATNATWNYPTSWGSCFQSGINLWAINKQNIEYNLSSTDTIVIQGKTVSLIQTP